MKTLEKVANDAVKCAETINLIYVKDSQPGIDRKKSKISFRYFFNGKKIEDEEILMRIKKLVLPPAWENVWICKKENGHLQATGTDVNAVEAMTEFLKVHPKFDFNAGNSFALV